MVVLILVASACSTPSSTPSTELAYPIARRVDAADTLHGVVVPDPYRWLAEGSSPEVVSFAAAQDSLTAAFLRALPQRDAIRRRIEAALAEPSLWVMRRGDRYFVERGDSIFWGSSPDSARHVLLDNRVPSDDRGLRIFSGGATAYSHDGSFWAYRVGRGPSDEAEIRVRVVETGADLVDRIPGVIALTWARDNKGFFYATREYKATGDQLRLSTHEVRYHRLGSPSSADLVVLTESADSVQGLGLLRVTDDGRFLVIQRRGGIVYSDLGDPLSPRVDGTPLRLVDLPPSSFHFVGNDGHTFYVWTNDAAPNGRIIAIDVRAPDPGQWRTIVPETAERFAWHRVNLVNRQLLVRYEDETSPRIRRFRLDGAPLPDIPVIDPGDVMVGYLVNRQDSDELFYATSSLLRRDALFRYDFSTGETTQLNASFVASEEPGYLIERLEYLGRDSTPIPLLLAHRKGLRLDGRNPTLLYGYGAYGVSSIPPDYSPEVQVWVELGGVYAVAGIRGGGEKGKEWHEAAVREKRQVTFDDVAAAAEFLISAGYTSPDHLGITGSSWGGTLVMATINQRPDLFAAAVPGRAGSGDVISEWANPAPDWQAEIGSPQDRVQFLAMLEWSPYQNIRAGVCYPATLQMEGANDDRGGRESTQRTLKYIAALQRAQACNRPVLLRIDPSAAHGGGGIAESVDRLAFLASMLGATIR